MWPLATLLLGELRMNRQLMFVFAVALAGCAESNIEKNFLCGPYTGQPCRTMAEIDGAGTLGGSTVAEQSQDSRNDQLSQPVLTGGKSGSAVAGIPAGGAAYQSARYRIPEKTGRLWLPPYLGDSEILHEGTYAHFVVREAEWGTR